MRSRKKTISYIIFNKQSWTEIKTETKRNNPFCSTCKTYFLCTVLQEHIQRRSCVVLEGELNKLNRNAKNEKIIIGKTTIHNCTNLYRLLFSLRICYSNISVNKHSVLLFLISKNWKFNFTDFLCSFSVFFFFPFLHMPRWWLFVLIMPLGVFHKFQCVLFFFFDFLLLPFCIVYKALSKN